MFRLAGDQPYPGDQGFDHWFANMMPAMTGFGQTERAKPMMWWLWHARGGFEVVMRDRDYKMLATMLPQADAGADSDAKPPAGTSIMEFIKTAELGRFEMYNLLQDPSESENLVEKESGRFESMKRKMVELHKEIRAEGPVYELGRGGKKKSRGKTE